MYVERVYDNPPAFGAPALILATFAFAWQIFFDFSGYTDMARGVAKLMGFNLILNFNNPYLATGLGEFWSRWHISLSTWFRDYVYIPLGGNRHGTLLPTAICFITFLSPGIWHGASWTFVIWGLLHGLGVMITRELERSALYRERVPKLVKQAGVFLFVCFAWIFFRAESLGDALLIVRRIFTAAWQRSANSGADARAGGRWCGCTSCCTSRDSATLLNGFVRVAAALAWCSICASVRPAAARSSTSSSDMSPSLAANPGRPDDRRAEVPFGVNEVRLNARQWLAAF